MLICQCGLFRTELHRLCVCPGCISAESGTLPRGLRYGVSIRNHHVSLRVFHLFRTVTNVGTVDTVSFIISTTDTISQKQISTSP